MNDSYVFISILGLASCAGVFFGLVYFEWYERHQLLWRIRLETVRQAAIAQTLARPKPMKVVKPHRLYTPPKPASPCDCPRCRLAQICQDATAAISKATSNPPLDTSTTHLPDGDGCGDDLTALQSGLIPAYLWPYVRINDVMPYPQLKSNRGRKKQLSTAGFACPISIVNIAVSPMKPSMLLFITASMVNASPSPISCVRPAIARSPPAP